MPTAHATDDQPASCDASGGTMPEPSASVIAFPASAEAIELRHLRTFVAVAEELSFGRAAERLFITQPAVSRQIRSLEQLVGCQLLRRTTRTVELTLAGEALLERARRLLVEVDAAVAAAQTVGGEIMGRIADIWQSVGETLRDRDDLQAQRAAWESLRTVRAARKHRDARRPH